MVLYDFTSILHDFHIMLHDFHMVLYDFHMILYDLGDSGSLPTPPEPLESRAIRGILFASRSVQ